MTVHSRAHRLGRVTGVPTAAAARIAACASAWLPCADRLAATWIARLMTNTPKVGTAFHGVEGRRNGRARMRGAHALGNGYGLALAAAPEYGYG